MLMNIFEPLTSPDKVYLLQYLSQPNKYPKWSPKVVALVQYHLLSPKYTNYVLKYKNTNTKKVKIQTNAKTQNEKIYLLLSK